MANSSTTVIKSDAKDPDLSKIREVARAAREGKVVAFPTETVYGIGGPMSAPGIVDKLVQIKGRAPEKPFAFHIGGAEMLEMLGVKRSPALRYFFKQFMPGPFTLIVLNDKGEKIGIRYPKNIFAAALINATGEPFVATSANLSGQPSPRNAEEAMAQLQGQVEYLIDGGPTEFGMDSTVIDMTTPQPVILRKGAKAEEAQKAIEQITTGKFPRKKILFVCTGNSCRSPMAEVYLKNELKFKGMKDEIDVASCGIGARTGATSTSEAIFVMKNREIDLTAHRSRPCTRAEVIESDLIICMSQEHFMFIVGLMPNVKDRIKIWNIPDPIGMGMLIYEEVIKSIEKKTKDNWNEIIS